MSTVERNALALLSFLSLALLLFLAGRSNFWNSPIPQAVIRNLANSVTNVTTTNATSTSPSNSSRKKLVLIYTAFFSETPWPGLDANVLNSRMVWRGQPCTVQNCEWTYDRNRFTESDLVIFHARNMPAKSHLDSLLQKKHPSQIWAYYLLESPNATPDTKPLNGLFHWTITYRRDSHFWSPYGSYTKLTNANQTSSATIDFSKGKDRLVAWIVSNCGPQLRKSFVHELQKYVKVDVFGACADEFGGGSCAEDCKDVLKHYKFYLSLENALCLDYATEKYWKHLGEDNLVPIVMNDPGWFSEVAIPGSYINVADFKTVKDFADYLQYLDKNSTAYNNYFQWRPKYRVNVYQDQFHEFLLAPSPWHCQVCEALHSANLSQTKVIDQLTDFWVTEAKCGEMDGKFRGMF